MRLRFYFKQYKLKFEVSYPTNNRVILENVSGIFNASHKNLFAAFQF